LTRLDASPDSKADTIHAIAAEQHAHAAYEHWAAHYRQKKGEETLARNFGRTAHKISLKAAQLSKLALRNELGVQSGIESGVQSGVDPGVRPILTAAAD
jgi:hypothetical protein